MLVSQIYELVNTISDEVLGKTGIVNENLTNVVDMGTELFNANAVDNYVRSLVNHIGKVIFVNRPYRGGAPSVLMDGWEYGSILEKVTSELPQVEENETWELQDGASYDPNIFYKPKVSAKFYNNRITFEIPRSIVMKQVRESFSSAVQLNGFLSMLYDDVEKALTVNMDNLIMRTINNMIGETVHADYGSTAINSKSGIRAINLLYLYNQKFSTTLTAAQAITTPEFIRFATYTMGLYVSRISRLSSLFNIGGKTRFTPPDLLHFVLLADFAKAADVYLQSDTFHDNFTRLPEAEIVSYWQASGLDYSFGNTSKIDITTAGGNDVNVSGILGVMFDRDALGVSNIDRRVTTHFNEKAEFYNNWFKFEAGYFNDTNENFIVFFAA